MQNEAAAHLKPIDKYLIEDAGAEGAQYWRGRSAHATGYDEVYIGQGDTPLEAYQDATEQMEVDGGYDLTSLPGTPDEVDLEARLSREQKDAEDFSFYVVIYVK